jgi:hypothetical protein
MMFLNKTKDKNTTEKKHKKKRFFYERIHSQHNNVVQLQAS